MKRIPEIDALRGTALFGILLVNIFVFHAPYSYYSEFYGAFEGIQAITVDLVVDFAAGKFLFIFAFLFGYGMILQKRSRPMEFRTYLAKRMVVLLLFGILHILLFWFGDILAAYALLGLIFIPFLSIPNKVLLTLGILFILFRPLYYIGVLTFEWPMVHAQHPAELSEFMHTFQTGSFGEIYQLRMAEFWAFMPENLIWYIPKTLGLFFIGAYAAQTHWFERIKARNWQFLVITISCIIINLVWSAYKTEVFNAIDLKTTPIWRPVLISANVMAETALGMGYIMGFVVLFQNSRWMTNVLAKTGRLALTNYILQSLICVLLFYSYGWGYYGTLRPTDLVIITVAIFSIQVLLSHLYFKYKQMGPLEYVWRKLINTLN